jgi:hypothetical protein
LAHTYAKQQSLNHKQTLPALDSHSAGLEGNPMDYEDAMKIVNSKIAEHAEASGYPTLQKTSEDGQGDSGEGAAPRSASAQITQANKVAARANSSAKTPTSSRATFGHVHRTPGSGPRPPSHLKHLVPKLPGLLPQLTPKKQLPPK